MTWGQLGSRASTWVAIATFALLGAGSLGAQETVEEDNAPWRLSDALGLPEWFQISGSHDQRFAYVFNQFRAGRGDDDRLHSVRTLLRVEARRGSWRVGAEMIDARAYRMGDGSVRVNNGTTNPVELLEAYLRYDHPSGDIWVRGGRFTLDLGSRRLVARHKYRNAINAFTGVEGKWAHESGVSMRALFGLPIQRRPLDRSGLEDNDPEFDREDEQVVFWGMLWDIPVDSLNSRLEVYGYGLHEDTVSDRLTADRELYTPGLRFWKTPEVDQIDYEFEGAIQFGTARAGRGGSLVRQDRFAYFTNITIGYTFDARWTPRVAVEYSYASGDTNPNDGDDERFDSLFGVQRPDFGPTEIYTAFVRSNAHGPALRVQFRPTQDLSAFVAYRAYWLASDKDAWVSGGVRDVTGGTDRFIGHHLEYRVRWDWIPDSVRLEAGAAWLLRGRFLHNAPNANNSGEPAVVYVSTTLVF